MRSLHIAMKNGPHTLQLEKACIQQWRSSAAVSKKVQHFYFLKSWLALSHGASEVVGCFRMKPNISFPPTGRQKLIEVHNEWKHCTFHERLIATEVAADVPVKNGRFLWSESNKQGLPKKQGVLTHDWVHLLLSKGHSCYTPGRAGEGKCKSIQGCTVGANLNVLNLIIIKRGRRVFLDSLILLCLMVWDPKELAKSTDFLIFLKNMRSASMLWESP